MFTPGGTGGITPGLSEFGYGQVSGGAREDSPLDNGAEVTGLIDAYRCTVAREAAREILTELAGLLAIAGLIEIGADHYHNHRGPLKLVDRPAKGIKEGQLCLHRVPIGRGGEGQRV